MSTGPTETLAFRVAREKAEILKRLARSTERDKSWHLEKALDEYLVNQAWQIAAIEEGLADAEAGRMVPHDEVRAWLLSWGDKDERDPGK